MKLTKLFLALASFGALVVGSDSTAQADPTDTFIVKTKVAANCSITAGDIDFGTYDPLAPGAKVAQNDIVVQCTKGMAGVTIGIGGGSNFTSPNNGMKATGPDILPYQIFQPLAGGGQSTVRWSGPTGTGNVLSIAVASITPVHYTMYGQIPPGQNVAADDGYSDSVVATVNF